MYKRREFKPQWQKRGRTKGLPENIVSLSDIRALKQSASSPFGPVKAGLTTLPRTDKDHQLLELLNSLERKAESLSYRSFEAYDILNTAIEEIRALLCDTSPKEGGTDT